MIHGVQDRTTDYAVMVVNGGKVAGQLEILACKRHLNDMENIEEYYFDVEEAERVINYANMLTTKDGNELKTRPFQNFILGSLFGWKSKITGERRYREAYVQVGRRNGKSFLTGVIATYFATFLGNKDRIFIGATKQDQANIVWEEVQNFIDMDDDMTELYKVKEHDRTITSLVTDTTIKSVGRDTKTLDGFGNILAVCDELHAHPNNQMYKLLLDGQADVNNALTLAITTAGFNLNSFCYKHYEFCVKILKGALEKDTLFIFICQPDKEDDIWDRTNWLKANPYYLFEEDGSVNKVKLKRYEEKAIDAKEKGGADLTNFMTKQLDIWVTATDTSYIDLEKFAACGADMTLEAVRGKKAFLGFDLSSGGDLTSISLTFPLPEEKVYVYSHSFMPRMRLEEHKKTDDAPYDIWVRQGLLTLTDGSSGFKTDYKYIIKHLEEIIERYSLEIIECGYDAHNAGSFLADLDFLGCPLTEVKQSAKSMDEPTTDFKQSVDAGQVIYDKSNALFRWSVANATITSNSFGEIKIDKQKQTNRIDPVDAVLDAWKVMRLHKGKMLDINDAVTEWLDSF